MYNVIVLMSSYNGEKFIRGQIESILTQSGVSVKLLVRDDGSSDETINILSEFERENDNVSVIYSENVGWRRSFSELVKCAPKSDYYAFADQDDYWETDKLITAIESIKEYSEIPCLYRGRSIISDKNLANNGEKYLDIEVPNKTTALFQNFCQGATLVFNNRLRDMYLIHPISIISHDVWLPIIAIYTGRIIDDSQAHMLYRIHDSNASAGKTLYKKIKKRISVIRKKNECLYHYNFGEVLFNYFSEYIDDDSLVVCKQMAEYRKSFLTKMSLLFNPKVRCNSFSRTLLVKYFLLTNSFRSDL